MNFPFARRHMHRLYEYSSEDVKRQIDLYINSTLDESKSWFDVFLLESLTPENGYDELVRLIKFFGLTNWEGYTPCAVVSNPGETPLTVQLYFMNECMMSKTAQNKDENVQQIAGRLLVDLVVTHADTLWKEILLCNTLLTLVDDQDRKRIREQASQAAAAEHPRQQSSSLPVAEDNRMEVD